MAHETEPGRLLGLTPSSAPRRATILKAVILVVALTSIAISIARTSAAEDERPGRRVVEPRERQLSAKPGFAGRIEFFCVENRPNGLKKE